MDTEQQQDYADIKAAKEKVKYWLEQMADARKREQDFRRKGKEVTEIYETAKAREDSFNILFSNTETLSPAVYNNLPRPVVKRRFDDKDPLGRVASQVCQRTLAFLVENDNREYTPFNDLIEQAVLEALLPGRGSTWFKYDAEIEEQATATPAEGTTPAEKPAEVAEKVSAEAVCGEEVPWDSFFVGYAKSWRQVPWVCREHFMDEDELEENFGEDIAKQVKMTAVGAKATEDERDSGAGEATPNLAQVYEVWDKGTQKVIFLSPGFPDDVLKEVDDPLKLSGFFPCPRPMQFIRKVSVMVPTALYAVYEQQAEEINNISRRISRLTKALKVRGFYNSSLGDMDKLMTAGDNALLPTDKQGIGAQDMGGLDREIWLMPIERVVNVLQQLYVQREQAKQVIYEITGISDIVRGSSVASETATAQGLKDKWGTLRLKRMQKEVARYVRDCLRIMTEIAVTKLGQDTIAKMTGLTFPTDQQKQLAQQTKMQLQQQQQQAAMQQQQQPPQPGQPPAPSSPPPPQQPMPPELDVVLNTPSWEEILAMLQDDTLRNFRIDIETNSTIDMEATDDKKDIGELLNAIAQFFNGIGPMVEKGILPFAVAKSMLMFVVRRYRFGEEIETQIDGMKEPPPPPAPGQDPAAQAMQQKMQMEMQAMQMDAQIKQAEMQGQQKQAQMDEQIAQAEMQAKMQEIQLKSQLAVAQHQFAMQKLAMQGQQLAAQAAMPPKQPSGSGG